MVNIETCKPTVFFDRDGVINYSTIINNKPYAPKTFEDFKIYNEVPYVFEKLKKSGFLTILVTNQPDLGNGLIEKEEVEKIEFGLVKKVILLVLFLLKTQ